MAPERSRDAVHDAPICASIARQMWSEDPTTAQRTSSFDVIVIGGGPAGAAAATLLARAGVSVAVLERERFPRFHVGESLLPCCQPVLARLGVAERIAREGFVVKRGATFRFEDGSAGSAIRFAEGFDGDHGSAFQVPRARFDQLLLEHAAASGARVTEGAKVTEVELGRERVQVDVRSGEGTGTVKAQRLSARYLVDASGQAGFLAKRLDLRRTDPRLTNVAAYAHFAGVELPADVPRGDIQVISRRDLGWLWVIPLSATHTSIGAVFPRALLKRDEPRSREEMLDQLLASSPAVAMQLQNAQRTTPVRYEAIFSYGCARYSGDRWLMAGDAGSFLDPVFSTGVQLALEAGAAAAGALLCSLTEGGRAGRRALAHYDRQQRARYRHFRRHVRRFYDPAFRDLLCQPSSRFQIIPALTTVLAGAPRPSLSVRWRLELFGAIAGLHRRRRITRRLHTWASGGVVIPPEPAR